MGAACGVIFQSHRYWSAYIWRLTAPGVHSDPHLGENPPARSFPRRGGTKFLILFSQEQAWASTFLISPKIWAGQPCCSSKATEIPCRLGARGDISGEHSVRIPHSTQKLLAQRPGPFPGREACLLSPAAFSPRGSIPELQPLSFPGLENALGTVILPEARTHLVSDCWSLAFSLSQRGTLRWLYQTPSRPCLGWLHGPMQSTLMLNALLSWS